MDELIGPILIEKNRRLDNQLECIRARRNTMAIHTLEEMEARIRGLERVLHQVDMNLTSAGIVSMSTRLMVKSVLASSDENYSLKEKV
jgi:hypothetical protein